MAPIPYTNTAAYYLDYNVCQEQHTLQMRCDPETTDSDASGTITALLAALSDQVFDSDFVGFRFRQAGSGVSLPAVWTGATSWGSGAGEHKDSANFIDFVGRDSEGVRVRVALFGAVNASLGGDYRVTTSESGFVAAAIAELTSDANMFWTVAGNVPVWNPYANIGPNAYWRNKIR